MITQKQRSDRQLGIGGTDIGVILGLSKYKSPYQLFLEKRGRLSEEEEYTAPQEWGNRLESVIKDKFEEKNNIEVKELETVIHPLHSFLRANIDGFIPEWNAVVEIKTAHSFTKSQWGEPGSDQMPFIYLLQVAHYVACMNADRAHVAVLIGGNEYLEFVYERDQELEELIIKKARHFWENVEKNIAPEPTQVIDLDLLYGKGVSDKSISLDEDTKTLLEKWEETKAHLKEFKKLEKDHKFKIMEYMKGAEYLIDDEGKKLATWKADKNGSRKLLLNRRMK